jgi:thiol-disulfide isomerase/thioredoxin
MKNFKILFLAIFFFLPLAGKAAPDSCFYYFYGDGCPHCHDTTPVIEGLEQKYPNIQVHKFETWSNEENKILFEKVAEDYNISRLGVPALFFGDKYYLGSDQIISNMENDITKGPSHTCPLVADLKAEPLPEPETTAKPGLITNPEVDPIDEVMFDSKDDTDTWQELGTTASPDKTSGSKRTIVYITISIVLIALIWLGFRKKVI